MIYLDHAATSFPKPIEVQQAVARWFSDVGVSPHRGDGPATADSAATLQRCREGIAQHTGHGHDRVAFCSGATEGLNLTLRALTHDRARVLTTPYEHSSVARPLTALREERALQLLCAGTVAELCAHVEAGDADLVVMTHASNVIGEVFDARAVTSAARSRGIPVILDASQTAGYLPLDVDASVVVASAHKGLHGPPGLGFISADADTQLAPQKFGGSGTSKAIDRHPTEWPEAYEAGTPNMPALYGLDAALQWIAAQQPGDLLRRSLAPLRRIKDALAAAAGFTTFHSDRPIAMPVLSLTHERFDPLELSSILANAGIHARAGFHCAPWIHDKIGTAETGTLRLSTGPLTTSDDANAVIGLLTSL